MSFKLPQRDFKPSTIIKTLGVIFVSILLLALAIRLVLNPLQSHFNLKREAGSAPQNVATEAYGYGDKDVAMIADTAAPTLSIRNLLPQPPMEQGTVGNTAEAFEATDYHAAIKTRNLARTCGAITDLKADPDIVFEVSNESDHACHYVFKAAKNRVEHVRSIIEGLNPKDLVENTYSIQRTVEDFTSEMEILEKKRDTIERTLASATDAYDNITALATNTQNADALARIIESKLQIVERLTQEQIQVNAQLERLARAKAQQVDNVEYTSFFVNITENKFLNGEQIKDSWNAAVKQFFRDVNAIAQELTVGLVKLLLLAIQYFVYILLLLLFAKLVWSVAKGIWKR